ncbi:MAG TPA: hypothetical protein VF447_17570 [Terriglobales bacterium]
MTTPKTEIDDANELAAHIIAAILPLLEHRVAEKCAEIAIESTRIDMCPISQAGVMDAYESGGEAAAAAIRAAFPQEPRDE